MTARERERNPGHELTRADGELAVEEEIRRRDQRAAHRTNRPGRLDAPQFVIVGAEVDAGIRLYASRSLPDAEFGIDEIQHRPEHVLTTVMRDMLVITRPTYPEALAELQRLWANRDRAKAEEDARKLEEARRAARRKPRAITAGTATGGNSK